MTYTPIVAVENEGEYWDRIEGEATLAVEQGMTDLACPHAAGSDEANHWLFTFENVRAQRYIQSGERAARDGLPIAACPHGLEPKLRDAWELGWRIVHDSPFSGFKDLEISFRGRDSVRK